MTIITPSAPHSTPTTTFPWLYNYYTLPLISMLFDWLITSDSIWYFCPFIKAFRLAPCQEAFVTEIGKLINSEHSNVVLKNWFLQENLELIEISWLTNPCMYINLYS